ncbi:MAG: protein-disulfide reductase DsbD N-terminal domain-containing protein [Nevskia sp.]|nr:protein-disulfide reductase DsbD N-terminal domain-containing protein [Nevskia sp.]
MNRAAAALCAMGAALCCSVAADGLWAKRAGTGPDLLTADDAFRLEAVERQGDSLNVSWNIAPGYYLYRKRLAFQAVQPAGTSLAPPLLPKGELVQDEHEGQTEVYHGALQAQLHWRAGSAVPQRLQVSYQGCAEAGVCYPPQTRLIDVIDLQGTAPDPK